MVGMKIELGHQPKQVTRRHKLTYSHQTRIARIIGKGTMAVNSYGCR